MLKYNIGLEGGGQMLSLHGWLRVITWVSDCDSNMGMIQMWKSPYIYRYTICKHWNQNFSIDLIVLKNLNDYYMKTTYLIELKLTGPIKQINDGLYTNFQNILNFYKKFIIFTFKVYRGLLWYCKYSNILK